MTPPEGKASSHPGTKGADRFLRTKEPVGTLEVRSRPNKEDTVTQMKHMATEATWDKAKELAILAQDPTKLHKTAFLEYLEVKGRQLAEDRALDEVETELRATTEAWKQAAKAKARKR